MKPNNLFKLIPTSRREEVTTSALAYLLTYAPTDLKKQLLSVFGVDNNDKNIHIIAEHNFNKTDGGRIDLLIETDGKLIGIENKHFSKFGENQLEGYWESIKSSAISNGKTPSLFALLPENHYEIDDLICEVKPIKWQELFRKETSEFCEVWEQLKEYCSSLFDPFSSITDPDKLFHYSSQLTDAHNEFLSELRYFLKIELKTIDNISPSKVYKGYYIGVSHSDDREKNAIAWVGVEKGNQNNDQYGLIVVTNKKFDTPLFDSVDINSRNKKWRNHEELLIGQGCIVWYLKEKINSKNDLINLAKALRGELTPNDYETPSKN